MSDWFKIWTDPKTEPYVVVHVDVDEWYHRDRTDRNILIYYRTYKKAVRNTIYLYHYTDELQAYAEGMKYLQRLKKQSDNFYKKKAKKGANK